MRAGVQYAAFRRGIEAGRIVLARDRFAFLLASKDYAPDLEQHATRGDVAEAQGPGYAPGGLVLPVGSYHDGALWSPDLIWPQAELSSCGAVLYVARDGGPAGDDLVAWWDFGRVVRAYGGDFELLWGGRPVMELK